MRERYREVRGRANVGHASSQSKVSKKSCPFAAGCTPGFVDMDTAAAAAERAIGAAGAANREPAAAPLGVAGLEAAAGRGEGTLRGAVPANRSLRSGNVT